jgi:hypothetical protein
MSKVIVSASGERFIVSDEVSEIDMEEKSESFINRSHVTKEIIDPINILFFFNNEEEVTFPIQINSYRSYSDKIKLSGFILITDFLLFLNQKENILTKLEIRMSNRKYIIFEGKAKTLKTSAKNMNAVICNVDLLFVTNI